MIPGTQVSELGNSLAEWTAGRTRAGARHLLKSPSVRALAMDDRLLAIAKTALGERARPHAATLFAKSRQANWLVTWHQDTALPLVHRVDAPGWGPWSVKGGLLYGHAPAWALERIVAVRVHLDDSTEENGPLRVIPKSHKAGVLPDEALARLGRTGPAVLCLAKRGDILLMRPLLVHASSKIISDAPRRVLHLEYGPQGGLEDGVELAWTSER